MINMTNLLLICFLYMQMLATSSYLTVQHTPDPITEGNSLTIACNITSSIRDALEWRKDGNLVSSCLQTCNQGSVLDYNVTMGTGNSISYVFIQSALKSRDNGLWMCSDRNQNATIRLIVREKIRLSASSNSPLENSTTILTCYMTPFTESLYWRKDDVLISTCISSCTEYASYIIVMSTLSNTSVITINQTSQETDRGKWSCSRGGIVSPGDSANVTLNVRAPVKTVTIQNSVAYNFTDGLESQVTCELGFTYPVATISWYKDGDTNTSLQSTLGSSSTLSYTGDTDDQGKQLYCAATNGLGETKSDSLVLDIKFPPVVHITPSLDPYKIIKGDNLALTCQVNASNPTVTADKYEWFFNGQRLNSSIYRYRSVSIPSEATGNYTCKGDNGVSHGACSSSPLNVDVLYAPVIHLPAIYKVIESQNLRLTCKADANPSQITYKWQNTSGVNTQSAILNIPSVNRRHSGTYTCTATNNMVPSSSSAVEGKNSTTMTLDVLYPPILTTPSTYKVIEHDVAVVSCSADANPGSITYMWTGPPSYQSKPTNETLTINKISRHLSGVYTCTARNTMDPTDSIPETGTNSSKTTIDVLYGPKVTIQGPDFHTLQENDTIEVMCTVISNPQPFRIYWKFGSTVISHTSTLVLSEVTTNMSGSYYCYAENSLQPSSGRSENKHDEDKIAVFVKEINTPKEKDDDNKGDGMSSGLVTGLAVLFSLALVGLVVVGVILLRKYRQRSSTGKENNDDDDDDNCPRGGGNGYSGLGARSTEVLHEYQSHTVNDTSANGGHTTMDTKVDDDDYVNYPGKRDGGDYVNTRPKPSIKPKPKLHTDSPYVNSR